MFRLDAQRQYDQAAVQVSAAMNDLKALPGTIQSYVNSLQGGVTNAQAAMVGCDGVGDSAAIAEVAALISILQTALADQAVQDVLNRLTAF